jgi:hypothetical protein
MTPYLLFLLTAFVIGGTRLARRPMRSPLLVVAVSMVAAAAYWSYRVIG